MAGLPMRTIRQASLLGLNSFGFDVRADRLIEVTEAADLVPALAACGPDGPQLVLGGGSNLILTRDLDGPVLRLRLAGRQILEEHGDTALVAAAAGETWHDFVQWSLAQGLAGIENLSLIPGTVGAAPIQNIGAYGVELADTFDSLSAVHRFTGIERRFDRAACAFGYRDSIFKHGDGRDWIITGVRLRLTRRMEVSLDYGEIREALREAGIDHPRPIDVGAAICAIRRRKLPDPAVTGNAGSFFKNPVIPSAQAEALRAAEPGLPAYPQDAGAAGPMSKLAAAWLIERCGWKGHREGAVGVHPRHALVLINLGGASGREVLALADRITTSVQDRFGVGLEIEPTVI